jgi:hypothetical protein
MDSERFDQIAKNLAGGLSRRRVMRGIGGSAAAVLLIRLTRDASAANDCAKFCQHLPPGPQRGQCVSDCAQGGGGLFGECQGDPARLCVSTGGTAVCCPADQVCSGGVCQCPIGTDLCGGQCYPPCQNGLVRGSDCICRGACPAEDCCCLCSTTDANGQSTLVYCAAGVTDLGACRAVCGELGIGAAGTVLGCGPQRTAVCPVVPCAYGTDPACNCRLDSC